MAVSSAEDLVVALDVDGVLVDYVPGVNWLDTVAPEFGLTAADFDPWFREHWAEVVTGQRAIEDALAAFADGFDTEGFLSRWFDESATLNDEVLLAAKGWVAAGARLVLATNQEHRRAADLAQRLGEHLDIVEVCYSARFGFGKPDARFFAAVEKVVGPARIVFIDDALGNVEAARAHGWHAIHYPHDADWREQVDRYFK